MAGHFSHYHLVLLPGLDGSGILFEPLLATLPEQSNVTVITYPTDKPLSLTDLAVLVEQRIKTLDNVVLLAESFSGLVALTLLKRSRVIPKGILFFVAFAESPKPWLLKFASFLPIHHIPWQYLPTWLIQWSCLDANGTRREVELFRRTSKSVSHRVLAYRLRIIASSPFAAENQRWSIPCIYVQASRDKAVPRWCAEWFQQRFSEFEIKTIDGGHFILQTKPKQCLDIISAFTRRLNQSRTGIP